MKKGNKNSSNKTCSTGGCSANYICPGVAVIMSVRPCNVSGN